ncbi:MAG: 50S ribosomal protein L29 [Candidatus Magasanikbacteria bacterium GW2011_GWA2_40_10]|uniref:Large ribosomal subunit protein uL29 n=1 Tax=Candidatus Magasanikbacteria bacterium GW2011_GWA2_40_10 TaxID=1619037 RepID=A0A0G0TBB8_9BACT|nr:MAG: 50S ribosomal protein L29 [Candidatus Magasanikbacteria bacterium GW2011_GWA2_40_10]
MEWEDIKNKSAKELTELLSESRQELQSLSFQAHSRQLKQVHKINSVKKIIAQISTLLKTK